LNALNFSTNTTLHLGWPNLHLGVGLEKKPHIDPEVQNGYMLALDNLVTNREESARIYGELNKYFSQTRMFGTLHAIDDRNRLDPVE